VSRTADDAGAAIALEAPPWHFMDLWLTRDQQGRRAFEEGDFLAAAALFKDPMWRGVALYRAGRYADAQQAFALVDSPESDFNQADALAQRRRYEQAAQFYTQALQRRPGWKAAQDNLALMQALLKQKDDPDQQEEAPEIKPDKIEYDGKKSPPKGEKEMQMLAAQNAETWMRNIQTSPTELLARKFALQAQQPAPAAKPAGTRP